MDLPGIQGVGEPAPAGLAAVHGLIRVLDCLLHAFTFLPAQLEAGEAVVSAVEGHGVVQAPDVDAGPGQQFVGGIAG